MPSTIPYDPSLVLANIVHPQLLDTITQIADLRAPSDAAEEELNSLIAMRRSLDMTKMEIRNLGINIGDLDGKTKELNKKIDDAVKRYVTAKITAEEKVQPLRSKISTVHTNVESPVDYVRTQWREMPLAADSLNMDVQYFSVDSNTQESGSFASTISGYVADNTSWMGQDASMQMSLAASTQVSSQLQKHDIAGTLVLTANCTHKTAVMLAPFVLNVDKGIRAWNALFPKDKIKMDDPKSIATIAAQDATENEKHFSIISGVTYGSSFVGMVHILNASDSTVSEAISNVASTLQSQMDAGSWFESESGGFGVNSSFGTDVKNLLSTQNVTSHVTLLSMGIVPSIVASDVTTAVKQFATFDPKSSMDAIALLSAGTEQDQKTVTASAEAARTGGKMVAMQSAKIASVLSSLSDTDKTSNKVLDINSMMTAFQDFITNAKEGKTGIPINYYLKQITKGMLAQMWVAKYLPGKYLTIDNDDAPPRLAGGAAGTPSPAGSATQTQTVQASPDSSGSPPPNI
jgi:hypothetical protein